MTSSKISKLSEVWIVDLNHTWNAEIHKQRTAVVLSCDGFAKLTLQKIVPITGWQPSFAASPWFYKLAPTTKNDFSKESAADAFQLRSVDRERLVTKIGVLNGKPLDEIA